MHDCCVNLVRNELNNKGSGGKEAEMIERGGNGGKKKAARGWKTKVVTGRARVAIKTLFRKRGDL